MQVEDAVNEEQNSPIQRQYKRWNAVSVSDRIRGNKDQDETKEGNYFSLMNM